MGSGDTILFVSTFDIENITSWSGAPKNMLQCLRAGGFAVEPFTPRLGASRRLASGLARRLARLCGVTYSAYFSPANNKALGAAIDRRLAQGDFGLLFAHSGDMLPYVRTDIPRLIWADAPVSLLLDYYEAYKRPSAAFARNVLAIEGASYRGACRCLFSSRWAAEGAVRLFGLDPARVGVLPLGANLQGPEMGADSWIDARSAARSQPQREVRLLFIGVDWVRKGGEFALQVRRAVEALGLPCALDIVGCSPALPPGEPARVHGFLDKNRPHDLARIKELYAQATFFILPTVAEAYGIVFCEAAGLGLPSLAFHTGGISEIVADQVTGRLFPLDSRPEDWARWIAERLAEPGSYAEMVRQSLSRYRERLNWPAISGLLAPEVEACLRRRA